MSRLAFLFLILIIAPALVTVVRLTDTPTVELSPLWSPDGSTIAYERVVEESESVYVMNADGSDPVELISGGWGQLLASSPDGREVAYVAYAPGSTSQFDVINLHVTTIDRSQDRIVQQLRLMPTRITWSTDGSKLLISDSAGAYAVQSDDSTQAALTSPFTSNSFSYIWSSDGTQIAYLTREDATGESVLWIMRADGSDVRQVNAPVNVHAILNWSPDGQKLILTIVEEGDGVVYTRAIINADGSGFIKLDAHIDSTAWSPDSSRIAYTRSVGDLEDSDIYVMNADGSQPTPLAASPDFEWEPAWSPDGSKLAFIGCYRAYANFCSHEVFTMNADGSGRLRLTATKMEESAPVWSSDGSHILLSTRLIPYSELYVQAITNGTPLKLSDDLEVHSFAWSPDGRKMGMVAGHNYQDYNLYTIDADGQQLRQMPIGRSVVNFAWSPDGQQLAMTTATIVEHPYEEMFENHEIQVTDVDGMEIGKVAEIAAEPLGPPVWSPDSRRLAFLTGDGEDRDLYVVDANGGGRRKLVTLSGVITMPKWSPAGDKLAVIAAAAYTWNKRGKLYIIDVERGTVQLVDSGDGGVLSFTWSPDGKKLVYGTELHVPLPDSFAVIVINADGTGSQSIANYSYSPSHSPFGGWSAEWSRDGTWLAFRSGFVRFTVMKADGSVHYDLHYNGIPRWSPDGRFLTFADYQDDTSDIYIMSLAR